jgi:hypothetical protein
MRSGATLWAQTDAGRGTLHGRGPASVTLGFHLPPPNIWYSSSRMPATEQHPTTPAEAVQWHTRTSSEKKGVQCIATSTNGSGGPAKQPDGVAVIPQLGSVCIRHGLRQRGESIAR